MKLKKINAAFGLLSMAFVLFQLSCMDVCPMNLPTLASIARMSRNKAN
ncbi:MAG: hypothetical protein K6B15_06520 [Parasporobacterium sp.]|nr:hypothetical protein [Parasporobacterium sp.]